jgi:hypothetical protein
MKTFKLGDRVKVIKDNFRFQPLTMGLLGNIIKIHPYSGYYVKLENLKEALTPCVDNISIDTRLFLTDEIILVEENDWDE